MLSRDGHNTFERRVRMNINQLLKSKEMTKYRLSKQSHVPYATLSDICTGKTELAKCSAETVYRLANALHVSMEELIEPCLEVRPAFELFKSNVCHRLKELGDIDFLIESLSQNKIDEYYEKKWYPESFYLLAMVDYVSRANDIPLCDRYNELRKSKLETVLFPASVLSMAYATDNNQVKQEAMQNAIPEFMRFNIVESEVRNVNWNF